MGLLSGEHSESPDFREETTWNGRDGSVTYIVAAISAIIFGLSFLFTKGALEHIGTYPLLALRFILAALIMWLLRRFRLIRVNLKGRPIWGVILLAVFEPIIYFICETAGIRLTTTSEAGLMISMIPVVVAILGAVFLKEIPTVLQALSIILSVGGVALIALGGGALAFSGHALGLLALGGAVFAAGGYSVLSRRLSTRFTPIEITYVMMWTAALFFGIMAVIHAFLPGGPAPMLYGLRHPAAWGAVVYLGVLSSVVAYFGVNYVLSKVEANRSAVLSNLVTVVSVAAGVVIRHEALLWYHWIGGLLILVGVFGTNRFARLSRDATAPAPELPPG